MRKVSLLLLVPAIAIALALPASAQSYPGTTSTTNTTVAAQVLGESLSRPVAAEVLGASQAQPESGGGLLPRTGAAIATWALAGASLLALGTALVVSNRRRRPVSES